MKFKIIFFFLIIVSLKIRAQNISVDYSPVITGIDQKYGRVIWLKNGQALNYINSQGLNIMQATTVTPLKSDMTAGNKTAFGLSGLSSTGYARIWNIKNDAIGFSAYASVKTGSGDDMTLKSIHLDNAGVVDKEGDEIGAYPSSALCQTAETTVSPDGNYTLYYNKPGFLNSDYGFIVIEGVDHEVRNFSMGTGYSYSSFKMVNSVIDNAGNIFVLSTINQSSTSYAYQLTMFAADDNKGVNVPIASLDKLKYVDDLYLNSDSKGAVYLSGRYLEHKDENFNAEGFFMQRINAATAKTEIWMNANFKTDAQDLKSLDRTMRVDKIVCLPDGSFGMVGECTFNTNSVYGADYLNERKFDWMESVLIMKVSAAGKILSSKIIERNQNIVDPAKRLFCGSVFLLKGTKCFMVYNESLGSIEKRKAGDKPINYSAYRDKSSMILAEIDLANCSYTEKYLNDIKPYTDKLKPILIPGFAQLCNDDKTIAVKLDIGVKGSCRYVFVNVE